MGLQGGTAAISDALSTVDRKNVKAIGISGQQHGFVPLDERGKVSILFTVLTRRHGVLEVNLEMR